MSEKVHPLIEQVLFHPYFSYSIIAILFSLLICIVYDFKHSSLKKSTEYFASFDSSLGYLRSILATSLLLFLVFNGLVGHVLKFIQKDEIKFEVLVKGASKEELEKTKATISFPYGDPVDLEPVEDEAGKFFIQLDVPRYEDRVVFSVKCGGKEKDLRKSLYGKEELSVEFKCGG